MTKNRAFLQSHPWLTFRVDVSRLPFTFWITQGAIEAKCEQVARTLLPPSLGRKLSRIYLAKGIQATTAIEGNTLSDREVRKRLRGNKSIEKSKEYQAREVDNIIEACEKIGQSLTHGGEWQLSAALIKDFNRQVLKGLALDKDIRPGELRRYSVGVANYRGAPHQDCQYLLDRLCEWINEMSPKDGEHAIALALIRAVLAHLYLAWIHPFGDGNGRTARLLEVHILVSAGVPTVAAHLLSNFYNQTRSEYYRQLDQASKTKSPLAFLQYALRGFVDQLEQQITRIRRYQWVVVWKDFVYDTFRGQHSAAGERKRELALALGKHRSKEWRMEELVELTPAIARHYSKRTVRTLARDLDDLISLKLIRKVGRKFRANREILQSFVPLRRTETERH